MSQVNKPKHASYRVKKASAPAPPPPHRAKKADRAPPPARKKKCRMFKKGRCRDDKCPYAHASSGGVRKTRKKRKRIGNNQKVLKRLAQQYRRFKIAKGDKRFKTKNLVKWTRAPKSKKKGKKRSRRIYWRKKSRARKRH